MRKSGEMKHSVVLFLFFIITTAIHAQYSQQEYISKYQQLAIEEMGRSGIPASIKMAQAILESGNGNSQFSRKSNNHFGIKCKSNWQGKRVYHDDDEKGECFRKYDSVEDSYIDHTNFLVGNPRYAFLFELPRGDYKGWAKGLKDAGYATNRHYDKALIKIIEENQLYRLDQKQAYEPMVAYSERTVFNQGMNERVTIDPFYGREIIKINNLHAIVAREGDTYEILAQSLEMEAWELYKFNDHAAGYRPQANEVVYLEPKNRKPARNHEYHTAEIGETMHFISQVYGVKLKPLYRRNRMNPGEQPQSGEVIYLRKKRPVN
jgi:hypothetical protein